MKQIENVIHVSFMQRRGGQYVARGPLGGPPRHLGWPAAVSLEFGGPRSFLSVALHKVIDDN